MSAKSILGAALNIAGFALMFVPGIGTALGLGAKLLGGMLTVAQAVGAGLMIADSVLLGSGRPKFNGLSSTNPIGRLYSALDTTAARKIVFGHTAMATDVRYQTYTGADQDLYHQIIACAAHKVQSIDEIWIDNEKAWTSASGVLGRYSGYLTVTARAEGTSSNGIAIDSTWTSSCTLTGCAYVYLRYKLSGPDQSTPGPFSGGVSNRLTIRGKGALVYDPRLDSTVAGGSGSQRAGTQSTWAWDDSASRNPALQELFYELGWDINSNLSVGKGIPPARLDLAAYITAANICDEAVALKAGGTEPRYRSDAVISEGDEPSSVRDTLCSAMNATLRDAGGKISLDVLHDDLSSYILDFDLPDVLGGEEWNQTPPLTEFKNIVRGRCVDPSDNALYQLTEYPQQSISAPDGIDRIDAIDYPTVQSQTQAQRLAHLRLMRGQFQGRYTATYGARAWGASIGKVVRQTHAGLSWSHKLFRVVQQQIGRNGQVPMSLLEEDSSIYAWTASTDEKTAITAGTPVVADPTKNPVLPPTSQTTTLIHSSYATGLTFSISTAGSVTISNHSRVYADKTVSVTGTGGTPHAVSGAAAGDLIYIYYDDATRVGGAVTYQHVKLAGGAGDQSAAFPSSTNPYRHFVCAGAVPASGTTGGGSDAGSGGGGDGPCVTTDTPVLMADGSWRAAGELQVGDVLRTQHEHTLEWGDYPVIAHAIAKDQPLFEAEIDGRILRGTPEHRVHFGSEWRHLRELGQPAGFGDVVKMTVAEAHTYWSDGILSHNLKPAG